MGKLQAFLQEARQEFRRINWPNWPETVRATGLVIVMAIGMAIFLGAADYLFFYLLDNFILQ